MRACGAVSIRASRPPGPKGVSRNADGAQRNSADPWVPLTPGPGYLLSPCDSLWQRAVAERTRRRISLNLAVY
jgi:hypothetical protein